MKFNKEIIIKLSTLAFFVYLIDGLEIIGVVLQLFITMYLTHTLLRNTYINENTLLTYLSVFIDGTVLYLMCLCVVLSPAPNFIIYSIGLLTMIKHLLHQKEIGDEITSVVAEL